MSGRTYKYYINGAGEISRRSVRYLCDPWNEIYIQDMNNKKFKVNFNIYYKTFYHGIKQVTPAQLKTLYTLYQEQAAAVPQSLKQVQFYNDKITGINYITFKNLITGGKI